MAVVAVKTESALHIELGFGPLSEDQTQFWTRQQLAGGAGIGRGNQTVGFHHLAGLFRWAGGASRDWPRLSRALEQWPQRVGEQHRRCGCAA